MTDDAPDWHVRSGQDATMRSILAQLELVSHGTTASPSPTAGSQPAVVRPGQGHPEGTPAGCSGAEYLYWRDRYTRQTTTQGRDSTITGAKDELKTLTGRYERHRPVGESVDETIKRMLDATEGWTPEEVEQSSWRMSARLVRKHRVTAGRDPGTGKPNAVLLEAMDPMVAARELHARGFSTRDIAERLGKHQTQIIRYLRRAA